ncbi:Putative osmoprotectant uptake system permease protein yehY [Serratia quinivorans]|uniref:Binding-protein-dependent transport systems inner membrane component n=1 Tax=Serratia proteamaculans (strain 568) TaxID=399741 RepID=A8GBR0_SERP5|nr:MULTISPECIES: ABC transporter permease [Serratia]MCS4264478.1 osmoprotectant transport system permease protein [Serratia sp. BIGb0163]QBX66304.1 ABC transporter permease [Serratia quinivorans]CAI0851549.1 Putative osmoprotectant uptake system permease protein yehY [Serratia quinivorans]CAI0965185.1 Putative osmoprotectant uptake system permease protein yehY [Serratia quinivorans]CAI1526664.1 Putative osmoprotectant uptake system permease protein yehY [Serratia quinivorans]
MIIAVKNRVLLTLLILLLLAAFGLPFLSYAPNRLLSGKSISLISLLHGPALWLLVPMLVLAVLSLLAPVRRNALLTALTASVLLALTFWLSGHAAQQLASEGSRLARTSWGSGCWLILALSLLMAADALTRVTASHLWRILGNLLVVLPALVLLFSHQLDQLSLLKEYYNRQDVFDAALLQHLTILLATLVPALVIGIPLGVLCFRSVRLQTPIFSTLNIIQTVPSIALFGLLIAPLAGLAKALPWLAEHGVSGIGMAPAIVALVLYALLPLVRSVVAGLQSVPASVIESASGMGLTRGQIFLRVQLPLALPLFLTGVRILAVQTVGMAVVAALIGAGGFGAIVFQGLLSSALDLVLLGVIPVIVMAVIVDSLFKFLVSILEVSRR